MSVTQISTDTLMKSSRLRKDFDGQAGGMQQGYGRAKQAYALYIWQKSQQKPKIHVNKFMTGLKEAVGATTFAALAELSENECESMRFAAEQLYGDSANVDREANTLLKILLKERLSRELSETTEALKTAEQEGNDVEIVRLMGVNKVLTSEIAQL